MILDTDVLIALLQGDANAYKAVERLEESGDRAATTIVSAFELLRGARISSKQEKNIAEVHQLLDNLEVLNLTLKACDEASKIYSDLRKKGCLIGEFDVLIAAIAKTNSEAVMTRDTHFGQIREIETTKW